MAITLSLPKHLRVQGWKVKIRDKERVEPPHITIFHKDKEWRVGLRESDFLVPPGGSRKDIDAEVMHLIMDKWEELKAQWDRMYPENPISSAESENI